MWSIYVLSTVLVYSKHLINGSYLLLLFYHTYYWTFALFLVIIKYCVQYPPHSHQCNLLEMYACSGHSLA